MHYTNSYILNPTHEVSIILIGCGGTGSQVLSGLARMNEALKGLNHPGLHVAVYDDDTVSDSNIGRQLFSPSDIGANKAVVSVTRINRYFGTEWVAVPERYRLKRDNKAGLANIIISCVDSAAARVDIKRKIKGSPYKHGEPYNWMYYWLDFGNSYKSGQAVLGTIGTIRLPKCIEATADGNVQHLPDVLEQFPELEDVKEAEEGPSCSIAQALGRQDLFINSTLANLGLHLLWKLFREGVIDYHGCYLNLDTMNVNPITIRQ